MEEPKLTKSEWRVLNSIVGLNGSIRISDLPNVAKVSYSSLTGKSGIIYRLEKVYKFAETHKEGRERQVKILDSGKEHIQKNKKHYNFFFSD